MQLARLAHTSLGAFRAPFALAAALVAVQLLGASAWESLRYERASVLAGELWRLVTAHLIHIDAVHMAWNVAGLALVAWLFAREFSARGWCVILAASTAAVDVGFLVFEPQLEWYVGFSGVLHGLAAAGVLAWLVRYRDPATAIVAACLIAKLAWEHFAGPLPFTSETLSVPVVHQAHSYGALGGLAAGASLLRGKRATSSPL
jgi:rhomboid family GlyGly-CTERM serine protease